MKTSWRRPLMVVAVVGLALAGCGDDDDEAAESAPGNTTTTEAASDGDGQGVAGCEDGYTDPDDVSPDREVARCEAGAPAAQPLPERTTVRMSSAFRLEFNSPLLLADSLGEFEKENIDFEFVNLSFADAVPQLAQGEIDAAIGGVEVALFNAGNQDLGIKMVAGNYWPADAGDYEVAQTGLWCRRDSFSSPDDLDFKEVEGMRIASAVGKSSVAMYYSNEMLNRRLEGGFDISQATVEQIPSADQVTALQNKAVDCAILLDPLWLQVKDDPAYVLAATQTPGEPLGGIFFGPSLLEDDPEAGVAFLRAVIRTINTHFDGDYHQDQTVVAEIAEAISQPVENVVRTPSLLMDWEIRAGTTDRVQQLFIDIGVITEFDTPVPEDKIVDRTFYQRAVGWD